MALGGTLITKEDCIKALHRYQSITAASESLGISRHQFRRIANDLNVTMNSEALRNRGTTQIPISKGLVIEAPDDFDLFLSSDWHCGSESCDYTGLAAMLERLEKTENAFAIWGGDQMECTPPGHHDGGRNSDSFIDAQIIRTTDNQEHVKAKINLIYGGNHGRGRLVEAQVDPDLIVASQLKVPYSTVPTVVQYVCPSGVVKVCGGHGRSGGENSMKELRKLREIYPDCAIYHLGHDHNLFAEPDGSLRYDSTGDEYWDPSWMCRTGSFLKYSDYARYGIMRPKPTGYLIAHIRKGKVDSIEVVKA